MGEAELLKEELGRKMGGTASGTGNRSKRFIRSVVRGIYFKAKFTVVIHLRLSFCNAALTVICSEYINVKFSCNFQDCSVLKQHDGYFETDLVILNCGQMMSTAPELVTSSPNFRTIAAGDIWPLRMSWHAAGPIHGRSLVESGFEPGALQPRSRDLTTRPPRPSNVLKKHKNF
ncbi:hypothetical protein AVEN_247933-1 [Araneus ventricosus]|uniref:Uncharacterized protein n=1 Tax=Araneus ventricosus TaxID=182803 RepID=A0A4Y2CI84_ARAVE|nr:hypothetical protein AVEN_247933-1 [Araneus ventricosus]